MIDQQPQAAPRAGAPNGVLFVSGRPDALRAFSAELREKEGSAAFFSMFEFDVQALTLADAATMLRRGIDDERSHAMVLIGGDLVGKLRATDIDALKHAAKVDSDRLLVLGVTDHSDEAQAFLRLGIQRIVRTADSIGQIKSQIGGAAKDAREAIESKRAKARTEAAPVVIVQHHPSTEGLLGAGGVIAVHASKGGAGKTSVATNIAYALSASGAKTILVDLNPDGGADHAHLWHYLKSSGAFEDFDDLFLNQQFGLSALARKMDFHRSANVVEPQSVWDAIVKVIDIPGRQRLDLLPGIRDQADYEAFTTSSGERKVTKILTNQFWVKQLIDILTRPPQAYQYIVLDTGTNRYTAMNMHSLQVADLALLVVDTESEIDMRVDEEAMRALVGQIEEGKLPPLKQRVIVANKYDPEFTNLKDIAKRFDFLAPTPDEPIEVIPLRWDRNSFRTAQSKGLPALALEAKGRLPVDRYPALADLKALINRIKIVYGDDGSMSSAKKGGFRLFGKRG